MNYWVLPLIALTVHHWLAKKMPSEKYSPIVSKFLESSPKEPASVATLRDSTKQKIVHSMEILDKALSIYGDKLSISFNGGKDCLVMLYLYLAVLEQHKKYDPIKAVYIYYEQTFPEIDKFNDKIASSCRLQLKTYSFCKLKEGFEHYLAESDVKAIAVGNRRTDPWSCDLAEFQPTDNNWPNFIRVHPILEWTYQEIWFFLVELSLDYCELYDEGYTSIGGVESTIPNPYLKRDTYFAKNEVDVERMEYLVSRRGKGKGDYWPAFCLQSDERERKSRISKVWKRV